MRPESQSAGNIPKASAQRGLLITLALDDSERVNYGKVGDLLAGVKAITGGKAKDT